MSSDPVCYKLPVARELRCAAEGNQTDHQRKAFCTGAPAPGGRGRDLVTSWGNLQPWEGKREKDSRIGLVLFALSPLWQRGRKGGQMNRETEQVCLQNPHTLGQGHSKLSRRSWVPQGLGASAGSDPKRARWGGIIRFPGASSPAHRSPWELTIKSLSLTQRLSLASVFPSGKWGLPTRATSPTELGCLCQGESMELPPFHHHSITVHTHRGHPWTSLFFLFCFS